MLREDVRVPGGGVDEHAADAAGVGAVFGRVGAGEPVVIELVAQRQKRGFEFRGPGRVGALPVKGDGGGAVAGPDGEAEDLAALGAGVGGVVCLIGGVGDVFGWGVAGVGFHDPDYGAGAGGVDGEETHHAGAVGGPFGGDGVVEVVGEFVVGEGAGHDGGDGGEVGLRVVGAEMHGWGVWGVGGCST